MIRRRVLSATAQGASPPPLEVMAYGTCKGKRDNAANEVKCLVVLPRDVDASVEGVTRWST